MVQSSISRVESSCAAEESTVRPDGGALGSEEMSVFGMELRLLLQPLTSGA